MLKLDRALVAKKVAALAPSVEIRNPEHFHLDELFDVPVPPGEVLGICRDLLEAAVKALGPRAGDLQALVIISLEPSQSLELEPPGKAELLAELASEDVEPPALYLMSRDAWKLAVRQEEYRRPLAIPEFVRDDWYPEYRTQRPDPDDMCFRSIWVSHIPADLA